MVQIAGGILLAALVLLVLAGLFSMVRSFVRACVRHWPITLAAAGFVAAFVLLQLYGPAWPVPPHP